VILPVLAGCCAAVALAGVAGVIVRPIPKLAPRVRPYTAVARARLGRSPDVVPWGSSDAARPRGGVLGRVFLPPVRAAAARLGHLVESHGDESLRRRLRQAGFVDVTPDEYRIRSLGTTTLCTMAGAVPGLVMRMPVVMLALGACGLVFGSTRAKGRLDRAVADRSERIRLELYTVNQLLAMHLRTGAGPVQAVQRVVDRGSGAVVEELDEVLTWVRAGAGEAEAFERAAALTAEPSAGRTYKLFAAGTERGADLAGALRALSEDLRDARRDELRQAATRRRAAMLVPTIAILAPVMLLFIAAPLPSVVFGR
jgi:Flp pilus assembly protein TadB